MTPAADPFMAGVRPSGLQRGRGGFLRSADDAPYVTDPTGELVKTGERKGLVKRLKYGSPSNRGREIEGDGGLMKWKQRRALLGIGMSDDLANACRELSSLTLDSPEFNQAADTIVIAADKLTRSELAADRGTHGHLLCERWDRGEGIEDIVVAGEAVGIDRATQLKVLAAWSLMCSTNGLEVLAIEASCVDDKWRLAGTLDRIVRTTRPLTFAKSTGELAVIPANTVLILDIKFGKCRKAHPIQIASYAQSVPYDTETETRGEWEFPGSKWPAISQTHALIAHGDFGDDTRPPTIDLVWVDLVAGREHGGETVVQAKAWAARDDVFSVAQIVEGEAPLAVDRASHADPLHTAGEGAADSSPPPSPALIDPTVNDLLPREGMPQHALDELEVDRLNNQHRQSYHNWHSSQTKAASFLTPDPARLALVQARDTLAAKPDEGADLTDAEFAPLWDKLKALFDGLDPAARSWRGELVSEAQRRGVPFHAQQVRTERTYQINKALIALCAGGYVGASENELLRALLALVIGDVALFPAIHPGHAVGSLSAAEATRLADLVDVFNGPGLAAYIDHDQIFRLRELSPA